MDTVSAADTPIMRRVGDRDVAFQRYTLDDIEHFGTKIKELREAINQRLSAKHNLDSWQKFRADQELEVGGIGVVDVLRHLRSSTGIKPAFALLCKNAGMDDGQSLAASKYLGPSRVLDLVSEAMSPPPMAPERTDEGPQPPKAQSLPIPTTI